MQRLFILFSGLGLLSSCFLDDGVNPASTSYQFQRNTQIIFNSDTIDFIDVNGDSAFYVHRFTTVEPGENIVFEYTYISEDDVDIADDEYVEHLRFEVPMNNSSISATDEVLTNLKTNLAYSCFCPIDGPILITKGFIEGQQTNENEWNIELELEFDLYGEPSKRVIAETFTVGNITL